MARSLRIRSARLVVLGALVAVGAVWRLPFPFPAGLGYVSLPDAKGSAATLKAARQHAIDRRNMLGLGALASIFPTGVEPARAWWGESEETPIVTFALDVQGDDGPETETVVVKLHPEWAPRGVRRFMKMLEFGDFEGSRIHHVQKDLGVFFGLPAEPTLELDRIKNDRVRASNKRGTIAFKQVGDVSNPRNRRQELFISTKDNSKLDKFGVSPIGEILEGMDAVDKIYSGYGKSPLVDKIKTDGQSYLDSEFPKLGKIVSAYSDSVSM